MTFWDGYHFNCPWEEAKAKVIFVQLTTTCEILGQPLPTLPEEGSGKEMKHCQVKT